MPPACTGVRDWQRGCSNRRRISGDRVQTQPARSTSRTRRPAVGICPLVRSIASASHRETSHWDADASPCSPTLAKYGTRLARLRPLDRKTHHYADLARLTETCAHHRKTTSVPRGGWKRQTPVPACEQPPPVPPQCRALVPFSRHSTR